MKQIRALLSLPSKIAEALFRASYDLCSIRTQLTRIADALEDIQASQRRDNGR